LRGIISIIAANGGNVVGEALMTAGVSRTTTDAATLLKRAQAGDQSAISELRRVLNDTPELWIQVGDLAKQAELSWIDVACPPQLHLLLSELATALSVTLASPAAYHEQLVPVRVNYDESVHRQ
jgi:hypothetical protein